MRVSGQRKKWSDFRRGMVAGLVSAVVFVGVLRGIQWVLTTDVVTAFMAWWTDPITTTRIDIVFSLRGVFAVVLLFWTIYMAMQLSGRYPA